MRWQPESDRCVECGFDWRCDIEVAIQQVERLDAALPQIVDFERWTSRPGAGVWSPSEYVWHLVDVLRIGAERLWLVSTDPVAHAGETVLDIGSGAGADVLISARRVMPGGRAIGLDMTREIEPVHARTADVHRVSSMLDGDAG
jgi:hypothetical protein